MADFSTYEDARNWLIGALIGAVGFLIGQVRKGDLTRLEERIQRLERDYQALASKFDKLP